MTGEQWICPKCGTGREGPVRACTEVIRFGWGSEYFGQTPTGEYVSLADYGSIAARLEWAEKLLNTAYGGEECCDVQWYSDVERFLRASSNHAD